MSVVWADYTPFDPGVEGPLGQLTRREARAAFERLMAAKAERIAELGRLLERNGIQLSADDESLQALNDWFRAEVEAGDVPRRLRPLWYAVVNDIALFLGDVIIDRAPGLRWVMFDKGARDSAFQRHVLMGFSKVRNPKYNFDIDMGLAVYGHQIIAGQPVEANMFVTWVQSAADEA